MSLIITICFSALLIGLVFWFTRKRYQTTFLLKEQELEELRKSSYSLQEVSSKVIELSGFIALSTDNLKELSAKFLSRIAENVQAGYGCLLLLNEKNQLLEITALYAFDKDKASKQGIKPGETLCGEAFLEKSTQVVKNLPANYVNINSGIGNGKPLELALTPIHFNGVRVGVLELGCFKSLSKEDIQVLDKIAETFAATVISLRSEERNKHLLKDAEEIAANLRLKESELEESLEELRKTQAQAEESRKIQEKRMEELMSSQQALMEKVVKKYEQREQEMKEEIRSLRESN